MAGAVFATIVSLCAAVMGQKPVEKSDPSCPQQIVTTRKIAEQETTTGVVAGAVVDFRRTPVVGAKINIIDTLTKKAIETLSDSQGKFQVAGLSPATYEVWISSPGLMSLSVNEMTVAAGEVVTLDIVMGYYVFTGLITLPISPALLDRSSGNKVTFSEDLIRRLPH